VEALGCGRGLAADRYDELLRCMMHDNALKLRA